MLSQSSQKFEFCQNDFQKSGIRKLLQGTRYFPDIHGLKPSSNQRLSQKICSLKSKLTLMDGGLSFNCREDTKDSSSVLGYTFSLWEESSRTIF